MKGSDNLAAPRKILIENGEELVPFYIYKCAVCGLEIPESDPHEIIDGKTYCGDCAFKLGLIDEETYLKNHLCFIDLNGIRAVVKNNQIHVAIGKFSWEKTSRERNSKEYSKWRNDVFERDKYTCQQCGKVGGKLNAHHIKEYSQYPDLRFELSNGLTLCEDCHRKIHRKKV